MHQFHRVMPMSFQSRNGRVPYGARAYSVCDVCIQQKEHVAMTAVLPRWQAVKCERERNDLKIKAELKV